MVLQSFSREDGWYLFPSTDKGMLIAVNAEPFVVPDNENRQPFFELSSGIVEIAAAQLSKLWESRVTTEMRNTDIGDHEPGGLFCNKLQQVLQSDQHEFFVHGAVETSFTARTACMAIELNMSASDRKRWSRKHSRNPNSPPHVRCPSGDDVLRQFKSSLLAILSRSR